MFWFKSRKIHVDCFTEDDSAAKYFPIDKASEFIPSWFKKLNRTYDEVHAFSNLVTKMGTLKGCVGFIDLYKQGLVMPLWCDLSIRVEGDKYHYIFRDSYGNIDNHNPKQYNDVYKNEIHAKINTPWWFKEKTGVKFFYTGCTWELIRLAPELKILNGIINYKHQLSTNINCFIPKKKEPCQYDLEAGLPLVQIVPLSEKPLVHHIHVVSKQELNKIREDERPYKFNNTYFDRLKRTKR